MAPALPVIPWNTGRASATRLVLSPSALLRINSCFDGLRPIIASPPSPSWRLRPPRLGDRSLAAGRRCTLKRYREKDVEPAAAVWLAELRAAGLAACLDFQRDWTADRAVGRQPRAAVRGAEAPAGWMPLGPAKAGLSAGEDRHRGGPNLRLCPRRPAWQGRTRFSSRRSIPRRSLGSPA